ncbi:hypothetical protein EDC96DRAFT_546745, partial [Choanephora cucurbitarum]
NSSQLESESPANTQHQHSETDEQPNSDATKEPVHHELDQAEDDVDSANKDSLQQEVEVINKLPNEEINKSTQEEDHLDSTQPAFQPTEVQQIDEGVKKQTPESVKEDSELEVKEVAIMPNKVLTLRAWYRPLLSLTLTEKNSSCH